MKFLLTIPSLSFIGFLVSTFLLIGVIFSVIQIPSFAFYDMKAFYTGGVLITKGLSNDLYNIKVQYAIEKGISPVISFRETLPFFHPPFVALLFAPLAFLPFKTAYGVVLIVNWIVFLLSISIFFRTLGIFNQRKSIFFYTFVGLYFPMVIAFFEGQLTFFLLLSFILSWKAFKEAKLYQAGSFLAMLLIKPHLIIVPLLFLFWKRQWKALLGFFIPACFLVVISMWIVGWNGFIHYILFLTRIPSFGDGYGVHPMLEPTIKGLLQLFFHTNHFAITVIPFIICSVVMLLICFTQWKGTSIGTHKMFDIQWAMLIVVTFLTSVHMNYHDLLLLLFPWIIFLHTVKRNIIRYILGMLIASISILFFAALPVLSLFSIVMMALFVVYIVELHQADAYVE